jgi:DNA-binding MarR family transcriptional regulator
MTKQAMAELVQHLEAHGYVERRPDPADRRAKLVVPTDRGLDVIAFAQSLAPALDAELTTLLGGSRLKALAADLETIREALTAPGRRHALDGQDGAP